MGMKHRQPADQTAEPAQSELTGRRRRGRHRSHHRRPGRRRSRPGHRSPAGVEVRRAVLVSRKRSGWLHRWLLVQVGAWRRCRTSATAVHAAAPTWSAPTWSYWRRGAPSGGAPLGPVTFTACSGGGNEWSRVSPGGCMDTGSLMHARRPCHMAACQHMAARGAGAQPCMLPPHRSAAK